ncbi:MAG: hypothetical protein D6798_02270 [Deltaproteobacteria bacterium]|nr:MAG: hypothetical protein D6798_02270 [Deltaproteobacteria bacterium]
MGGLLTTWIPLALAMPARAGDGDGVTSRVALGGDLKNFGLVTFPYENPALEAAGLWPGDPQGQAIIDGRLKLRLDLGQTWRVDFQHAVSTVVGSAFTLGTTGAAATAPELVDLTWTVPEDAQATTSTRIQGRTDRLSVQGELGAASFVVGRQPISFGTGLFFTPLDLVSPFFPGTIDTEYKPGVDAVRVQVYGGLRFEQQVVAAWVGDCVAVGVGESDRCEEWGVEDLAVASWSRVTVGVSDIAVFLGEVHDDEVAGLSVASAVGAVGVHGDASVTLPPGHLDGRDPTEDVYVRAVVGADWRPNADLTLSGEAYVQTNGATDPADYLSQAMGDRYLRGELWALGRSYVGLSAAWQVSGTVAANLAAIGNLEDGSAMLLPGLSVSVADDADLSLGAYVGLGDRPDGLTWNSELGFVPTTAYSRMAMYF